MPKANAPNPKKKSNFPDTAVKIAPTINIKKLHIGKATAVTAQACLGVFVHLVKSLVIVLLTINVPIDAVKPSAKVQGSPTTDETSGLPPVPAATTLKIEYIIHEAKMVTDTTANFPIHAIALMP